MISRALTIAIATTAAGCSIFLLGDGFTSGDDDASAPIDGGGEAAVDAPTVTDAPSGDVDAGPTTPFCESLVPKPTFCDDFERTELVGPWNEKIIANNGTLSIEPHPEGNRSLFATMPVVPNGVAVQARLLMRLGMGSDVLYSFKLRIDALPPQGSGIQINDVFVAIPNKGFFASYLFVRTTGITFVEQTLPNTGPAGVFNEHKLTPEVKLGVVQRVTVHMMFGAAPRRLQVKLDDVVAYEGDSPAFQDRGNVEISGGIHYTEPPAGGLAARIDDVHATVK